MLKTKKLFLLLVLLLAFNIVLIGCNSETSSNSESGNDTEGNNDGDSNEIEEEAEEEKTFELNFSTASVPNDAHTEGLNVLKESIEEKTDGQIKVNIHHSGSLYTQENEADALIRGNLEMAYTGAEWLAEELPFLSMFTAAYLYKDYDHMTSVLNGEIGEDIFDQVAEELGIRPLGAFYLGTRQINYRDVGKEIRTPEDMKGLTLRMPGSPTWLFVGEAMGANPTPVDFSELYMALNTGTVDAQDNPLPTVKSASFYEVTDYVSLTNHIIASVWPTINEDVWQEMGEELQEKILEAVEEAREFVDQTNLDTEKEVIDFLEAEGIEIIEPDVEAFSEHVQQQYLDSEDMSSTWDMDLYNRIKEMAE
ncbi:DctP family TRAP transporter solute-binding subunit [Gracilibacillus salitolerans]|uniref:DctP family TRAP transporter solute-binding subunit n=1 Tax=Gracilibacillus salitolerans TaxID=2663022 RepID=A0A5Q2TFK2_9BACI|nr:sialic acid TRAP transporter substrate-binding protein SiaP [Gracilibacillus salitolerans]QGH33569.1 DctP family TRAP transporter solute-binding subunit [Gracilibacillus salitolerans]